MAQQFLTGVKITAGDEDTLFLNTGATGQQTTIFYQVNGSYKYQQRVGANWELYNYTVSNWDFHLQGSTGYFGLGHNDPKARLHLKGDDAAKSAIRQSRTGTTIWDQAIDSSGRLQWGTRASEGGTRSVHFTLDDNSKVGVGIASPDSKLHVEFDPVDLTTTNLDNSSAVALSLTIPDAQLSGNGKGVALALGMNGRGRSYIATEFASINKDATDLVFYNENGGVINERFRIDQTGDITATSRISTTRTPGANNTNPTIAFGDGNTGFYERSDNDLRVTVGGVNYWEFSANCMGNVNQGKAHFNSETATATNPSIIPWRNDSDTGIGRGDADVLSLIAGGVEALSLSTTDATFAGDVTLGSYTGSNTGGGGQTTSGALSIFENSGVAALFLGVKNASYANRGWSFKATEVGVNSKLELIEHGLSGTRLTIASGGNATFAGNIILENASSPKIDIKDTTNNVLLSIYSQNSNSIIGTYSNHPLKLFSNSLEAVEFDTSQNATFAGDVDVADTLKVNQSYQTSNEYLLIGKNTANDGGIVMSSKSGSSTPTNDWQIINSGSARDLHFYAYGLGDNALILDRETGDATFGSNVTIGALTSGETGQLVVNNEGGVPPVAKFMSRTNKATVQISDNDTTGYVSSENGLFSLGRNAGVNANNINIDASNEVGIGTSNPLQKLHVVGTQIRLDNNSGGGGGYYLHNSSGTFRFALWDNGADTRLFADGNGSTAAITINDNNTNFSGNIDLNNNKAIRLADRNSKLSFVLPYFTHGTSNLAVDLILGNAQLNGILELKLTSGYSHQNAVGEAYFKWIFGFNQNNSIWYTPCLVESNVTVQQASQIYVDDPAWDSTNNRYFIRIYHKTSTGNQWEGTLENTSQNQAKTLVDNFSVGSLLTNTSTSNTHHHGKFLSDSSGNVALKVKQSVDTGFNSGLTVERSANTQKLHIGMDGGAVNFNSPDGLSYKFRNSGAEKFTLDGSGNATFAGNLTVGSNALTAKRVNINSFTSAAGLVMDYGNAAGTVEFISLKSNGVTAPIKLVMRQSPNQSDLVLAGSSGSGLTLDSSSNATFAGTIATDRLSLFTSNTDRATIQAGSSGTTGHLYFNSYTGSTLKQLTWSAGNSGFYPQGASGSIDLGLSGNKWNRVYADEFHGDGSNLTNLPTPSGTVTGTGSDNRLAIWNGTTAIDSDADFYVTGSTLHTNGLQITSNDNFYRETINSASGGESFNASNGWHRIIEITGGSGRGKCHFLIQGGGGSGTPFRFEAIVNTAWSNAYATLTILHSSYPNFLTHIRVVRNSTSGKAFVDIKGSGEDSLTVTILPAGSVSASIVNFTNVNTLPTGDSKQIEKTITEMIMSLATGHGANTSGQHPFQVKYDGSIFGNHMDMHTGNVVGKFAVMSTGVHGSYDFYNNGTSYFNGAVIIDDALDLTGSNRALKIAGTTRINSVGDIIGTSYYVGGTNIVDTNRNASFADLTATGKLNVNGKACLGDGFTDKAVVYGHLGIGDDDYPKIAYPGQNALWSGSGSTTGQIVIDLPGTLNNYDMMYMEIDIYEYSGKGATKLIVGGHNWNSGGNSNTGTTQWYNVNVQVIGQLDKPVYVGRRNDGTNERRCIAIGETTSSWSYSTVHVHKVHGAGFYSTAIDWIADWNIAQTTSTSYFTKNPTTNWNSNATQTLETNGILKGSAVKVTDFIYSTGNNLKFNAAGTHVLNIDVNKKIYPQTDADTDLGFSTSSHRFRHLNLSGTVHGSLSNMSAYQLNGTYIVDSSRNLVNIGTITCGNITTSSRITFDYNGSSSGNNYLETGTDTLAFKNSGGTSVILTNFSTGATTFSGNVAPNSNEAHDLGLSGKRWSTIYGTVVDAGYFRASQSSTSDPILRLTDTGVANYDVVFPDTNTYRLETDTSSTKTFRLHNAGSGNFKMQADEFVKTGGTSSQFLMADGSISTHISPNGHLDMNNHDIVDVDELEYTRSHPFNVSFKDYTSSNTTGYTTSGGFDDWVKIANYGEAEGNTYLNIKSDAHSSFTCIISRGYHSSNAGSLTLLSSTYNPNSTYAQPIGIRLIRESDGSGGSSTNYSVQVRLFRTNTHAGYKMYCKAWGGGYNNINGCFDFLSNATTTTNDGTGSTVIASIDNFNSNALDQLNEPYTSLWAAKPIVGEKNIISKASISVEKDGGELLLTTTGSGHGSITTTDSKDLNISAASGNVYVNDNLIVASGEKVGIGVAPTTLLHLNGSGDAIRVESTNTGAGGAQIDLLHFTTSPADEDTHGMINMGGYYTGTTSVYGSQILSKWTDVSERHSRLEFKTCDTTLSTVLTLDHAKGATFTGTVQAPYITANNPSGAGNGSAQEVARFINTTSGATSSYMYIGASSGTDWRLGKNINGATSITNFGITKHSGTAIAMEIDTSLQTRFRSTTDYVLGLKDSAGSDQWWLKAYTNGNFALHENGVGDKLTIAAGGNATFHTGNITAGPAATNGGRVLAQNYSTSHKLGVISSHYSSGNFLMGYGVEGKSGSNGFVSTFSNFSGDRACIEIGSGSFDFRTHGSATNQSIGGTVSMTSRFSVSSAGTGTFSGDVVAFSDERLKSNIKTLDGSKVYDMRGVSFTKDDKEGSGVIAQELEKVAPELVNNDSEYKSVAYGNITGYLIEAIKDLKAEIEDLKKQIK